MKIGVCWKRCLEILNFNRLLKSSCALNRFSMIYRSYRNQRNNAKSRAEDTEDQSIPVVSHPVHCIGSFLKCSADVCATIRVRIFFFHRVRWKKKRRTRQAGIKRSERRLLFSKVRFVSNAILYKTRLAVRSYNHVRWRGFRDISGDWYFYAVRIARSVLPETKS